MRFGLTSVHHSAGNLFALQHVRADGKLLHSQDTAELEEGKGYNEEKVLGLLSKWAGK